MASMIVQLLGFFLGLLGFLGTAVATIMPQWRRTGYMGSNIITSMAYMKGLWMECVWNSAGIYQCEIHRSTLALPQDMQAARALMTLSCISSILATALSSLGMECTRCIHRSPAKCALAVTGGGCFLTAGLLCLTAVSWTSSEVIRNFSNPVMPDGMKYEIGQAVYIGFISSAFSITGGVVLCLACGQAEKRFPYLTESIDAFQPPAPEYQPPAVVCKDNHTPSRCSASSSGYRLSDYV
ncbi:claudin-14-like [Scleropages formosus]|uniref:Claudin n=2 Tax=Scleropages formosus TaxID=113540 RepID=A0A8C9SQ67_SCLFO|nr:claudin-14-like [Scleropages formosus]